MKSSLAWGLAVGAVGLAFALTPGDDPELVDEGDREHDPPEPTAEDPGAMTLKKQLYDKLVSLPQLSEDQRLFLMLVAWNETATTWKPNSHNDTASEVEASRKAYEVDGVSEKLETCAPRERWVQGSGGLFGMLMPYFGLNCLKIFGGCVVPEKLYDSDYAIVTACMFAAGLQKRDAFERKPTVGVLRTGWGWPARMDNPPVERIAKYQRQAVKIGLPVDFIDRKLGEFPSDPKVLREMLAKLKGTAVA